MNEPSPQAGLLRETQAACLAILIQHIRSSHSQFFSGYLLNTITLWELGYQRLIRQYCTTCHILVHWLLRAERQTTEPLMY
jgi:hypothetical protein